MTDLRKWLAENPPKKYATRLTKCFINEGCQTVEDVRDILRDHPDRALRIPNFGKNALAAAYEHYGVAPPLHREDRPRITVRYTNYRGETSVRHIAPISIRFTSTEQHPEPQWILRAFDRSESAIRDFALWGCDFVNDRHAPQ